jgi:hypothetical protein
VGTNPLDAEKNRGRMNSVTQFDLEMMHCQQDCKTHRADALAERPQNRGSGAIR